MEIIIFSLVILLLLVVLTLVVVLYFEKSKEKSVIGSLETVLFLVMMPKNRPVKEGEAQKEEKLLISQMEQVLANFLSLKKPKMFQPPLSVALEIASQTGGSDISFYVAVPQYLETVFEKYVQGVYTQAIVEKIPNDYTVFEPQGKTAGAYLTLKENFLFPIITYQKLEKDPISTITNTLSKISADEGAAIQLIIRPSGVNLKMIGEKVLQKIREGEKIKDAMRGVTSGMFGKFLSEFSKAKLQKEEELTKKKEQGFDQVSYDAIQTKIQKSAFETNIRLVAAAPSEVRAEDICVTSFQHLANFLFQLQTALTQGR